VAPVASAPVRAQRGVLVLHRERASDDAGAPQAWLDFPLPFQPGRVEAVVQLGLRMVFGEAGKCENASIAAELGVAALENLVSAIRGAVGIVQSDPGSFEDPRSQLPRDEFHEWAGCVKVSLPPSGDAVLYLNGAAAENLLGAGKAKPPLIAIGGLTPVRKAAVAANVGLSARLNAVELTFGQLKSLQVGDVVVLPHALEEPLRLITEFDAEVCRAYLGRVDERRSVQVVRSGADSDQSA
jgi:hypothetical protein